MAVVAPLPQTVCGPLLLGRRRRWLRLVDMARRLTTMALAGWSSSEDRRDPDVSSLAFLFCC